jgi:hypothetical protein
MRNYGAKEQVENGDYLSLGTYKLGNKNLTNPNQKRG